MLPFRILINVIAQPLWDYGWCRKGVWRALIAVFALLAPASVYAQDGTADDEPHVTIASANASITEGVSTSFILTRTGDTGPALRVNLNLTMDGQFAARPLPSSVTFAAGSPTVRVWVRVTSENAREDADDGTLHAVVVAGDGYTVGDPASASVTIEDGDPTPLVSVADVAALESAGAIEFEVRLQRREFRASMRTTLDATVDYATSHGTAGTADYTETIGTLTFTPSRYVYDDAGGYTYTAGRTSETIRVPIANDGLAEADETFTLTLSNPKNVKLWDEATTLTATGTIEDDEPFQVTIVADASSTTEGGSGRVHALAHGQPRSAPEREPERDDGWAVRRRPAAPERGVRRRSTHRGSVDPDCGRRARRCLRRADRDRRLRGGRRGQRDGDGRGQRRHPARDHRRRECPGECGRDPVRGGTLQRHDQDRHGGLRHFARHRGCRRLYCHQRPLDVRPGAVRMGCGRQPRADGGGPRGTRSACRSAATTWPRTTRPSP